MVYTQRVYTNFYSSSRETLVSQLPVETEKASQPCPVHRSMRSQELLSWSYHMTPQSNTGETPFRITYGIGAMIPVELIDQSWRVLTFNKEENGKNMLVSLDLLPEDRKRAHWREAVIKQRSERCYNSRVDPWEMEEGDLVLRRKTRTANDNKLGPNWEGPFRIARKLERGAYYLEELDGRKIPRAWNNSNLQFYYS